MYYISTFIFVSDLQQSIPLKKVSKKLLQNFFMSNIFCILEMYLYTNTMKNEMKMTNTMTMTNVNYQPRTLETSQQTIEFQKDVMKPHFVNWNLRYDTYVDASGVEHTSKVMIDLLPFDWNQSTPNEYDGSYHISSWEMPYALWCQHQSKITGLLMRQLKANLAKCEANPSVCKRITAI